MFYRKLIPFKKNEAQAMKKRSSKSLAATLATVFVTLSIVSVVIASFFQVLLNLQAQQEVVYSRAATLDRLRCVEQRL